MLDVQLKCDLAEMEEFETLNSEFDMSRAKKKVSRAIFETATREVN